MTILYWLDHIQPSERLFVGEKAFLLSQLKQQGYQVLPGFVISSQAFQSFLENLEDAESLLIDFPYSSLYLDVNNYKALQLVAQQSSQAIFRLNFPSDWLSNIVQAAQQLQSSALIWRISLSVPVSTPLALEGLFPAQLSWVTPEAIEFALKTAWTKLFSSKSLFYWQRVGIGIEKIQLAILVQPFNETLTSGKVFIEPHRFRVQATWGLGQSLLYGEILPDTYEIDRSSRQITSKRIGNKPRAYHLQTGADNHNPLDIQLLNAVEQETFSLNDSSLEQLLQLLQRLTEDIPQLKAIEWLLTPNSKIYLLQCSIASLSSSTHQVSMTSAQPLLQGYSAAPGVVVAPIQVITQLYTPTVELKAGNILVAPTIVPEWLPLLKKVAGFIIEEGGITSHAAIIARELKIPAIVGVPMATKILKTGDLISLNGDTGMINRSSIPSQAHISNALPSSATLAYPIGTQLMVNMSQSSSIAQAAILPVDGVGLLRSEWLISELLSVQPLSDWLHSSQQSYFVEQLAALIRQFTQAFFPRPVFYRSWDGISQDKKEHSFLGERGTFRYLLDPTLFELELQALQQVQRAAKQIPTGSLHANINLILPFVRSVEEFGFCQERIKQAHLTQSSAFQLWIMAEVPSVIFQLADYVQAGVQGIAIGTNDLTQLLLGVDREQTHLHKDFNATHQAMLAVLKQLIHLAKSLGIPCSICGQAPVQYPALVDNLIEWGITTISVEPEAVLPMYQTIARAEQRLCLEAARKHL